MSRPAPLDEHREPDEGHLGHGQDKPDAGKPPPKADPSELLKLGDRAQAFAEIAQKQEEEGDPQGIEGGTETQAKAGDLYRGKLVMFFRQACEVTETLGDTSKLVTVATFTITADLHIGTHQISKSSGVPLV